MKLSTALGEGAFGRVMKGALLKDGKSTLVAVKMLKGKFVDGVLQLYCGSVLACIFIEVAAMCCVLISCLDGF